MQNSQELHQEDVVEILKPGERQNADIVEAGRPLPGFEGIDVWATLEKKNRRKQKGERNQDNVLADPHTGLFGVMDGLGGMGNGDQASMAAELAIMDSYEQQLEQDKTQDVEKLRQDIIQTMKHKLRQIGLPDVAEQYEEQMRNNLVRTEQVDPALVQKAHALLKSFEAAQQRVAETGGMTTACIGLIHKAPNGARYAIIANIGDSGAFLRRADGRVEMLTREDAFISQLVNMGVLNQTKIKKMRRDKNLAIKVGNKYLTYEDLKSIMNASLGQESEDFFVPLMPSLEIFRLEPGDELFMVTDGVLDQYEENDEPDTMALAESLNFATPNENNLNVLREEAKLRGQRPGAIKKDDDIAAVKVKIK